MMKIIITVGCRPDCIKMMPLIKELKKRKDIQLTFLSTGQHSEMIEQVFDTFQEKPDYDLAIMKPGQSLFDISVGILDRIQSVLREVDPDIVLVHGDTSTAFVTSLACFYLHIPVGHVEAGLRTYDMSSPFPEEFNRQAIGLLARYHFAPTELAREYLIKEGKNPETVFVTGNTVIDAMRHTVYEEYRHPELDWVGDDRLVFITAHRRENLGEPMRRMFRAIRRVLTEHQDVKAVYPVHKNPVVREIVEEELRCCDRLHVIDPIGVSDCHNFEAKSYLILTDSGGIQEEAAALGVPVLVMRDTTERPEGVESGTLRLVGTSEETIYREFTRLLDDRQAYDDMSGASNPYGDGHACERIADILEGHPCTEWCSHTDDKCVTRFKK